MDISALVERAVGELGRRWELPGSGFIAGGAVSNLVWEYVSGTPAKINDIDVFVAGEPTTDPIFVYKKSEWAVIESYNHMVRALRQSSKYRIFSCARSGMINLVTHSKCDPATILGSFDINATCVGYSLDERRAHWTPAFEEFLATGMLRVSNVCTPAHTAVRMAKKARDLSVPLDPHEMDVLAHILARRPHPSAGQSPAVADHGRLRFKKKYADMFLANEAALSGHFSLARCPDLEEILSQSLGVDDEIYTLVPVSEPKAAALVEAQDRWPHISSDVLFYFRNVHGRPELERVWQVLKPMYASAGYADPSDPDLDAKAARVSGFLKKHHRSAPGLLGLTLDQQDRVISNVMETVGSQFCEEIAAAVVGSGRVRPEFPLGEFEAMFLGLSVSRSAKAAPEELPF